MFKILLVLGVPFALAVIGLSIWGIIYAIRKIFQGLYGLSEEDEEINRRKKPGNGGRGAIIVAVCVSLARLTPGWHWFHWLLAFITLAAVYWIFMEITDPKGALP